MTTISVTLDDELARRALEIAQQQDTTIDSLVRDYLQQLAGKESVSREDATEFLMQTIEQLSRPLGSWQWTNRDDLYDR